MKIKKNEEIDAKNVLAARESGKIGARPTLPLNRTNCGSRDVSGNDRGSEGHRDSASGTERSAPELV